MHHTVGAERLAAPVDEESIEARQLIAFDCSIFELFNSGLDHTAFFRVRDATQRATCRPGPRRGVHARLNEVSARVFNPKVRHTSCAARG